MDADGASTVRLQELMGRVVVDATGRRLGRVVECLAERRGDDLCVTTLLVGPRAWIGRFGSGSGNRGRQVRWDDIVALAPHIMVRTSADTVGTED